MTAKELAGKIIGLDYGIARYAIKMLGFRTRITNEDGRPLIITMDYRTDRINLHIKNGKVIMASMG